jgi:hypothetical protein
MAVLAHGMGITRGLGPAIAAHRSRSYDRGAMDWIFQADHPVDDEVAQEPEDWWNTPHHRDQIAVGDRVWLQVSGRHSPGLYYVATVVRPVYMSPRNACIPRGPALDGGGRTLDLNIASYPRC